MKKTASLSCLSLALALVPHAAALAQNEGELQVVKTIINAESENPELCLEFDRALAPLPASRLSSMLRLEAKGTPVTASNISAKDASLCLFPLDRGTAYRLDIKGLRGADNEKMTPYTLAFTVPDRSPVLSFMDEDGSVNEFGAFDTPLTLRAVNVPRASIDVYRITDPALMARVWQDRALTTLAPSESAYLGRNKGVTLWREEETFALAPNVTVDRKLSLREKMPDLAPGLYLIVADAGSEDKGMDKKAGKKGLAPLAAAWFVKSDFSLRAVRDGGGIHVFSSAEDRPKENIQLLAFNKEGEKLAEMRGGSGGVSVISGLPEGQDMNAFMNVIGIDPVGNVAFADIESLPLPMFEANNEALRLDASFVPPLDPVDVSLFPSLTKKEATAVGPSVLRLLRGGDFFSEYPVPAGDVEPVKVFLHAPATQGDWTLRWQRTDGMILAEKKLRVTANPDAPQLQVSADREFLANDKTVSLTIRAQSASGKAVPLAGGYVALSWQRMEKAPLGWKDYRFGTLVSLAEEPTRLADFLTDLQGTTTLRLTLPPHPAEPGLYQAVLRVVAEPDAGVSDAPSLVLPLRSEETTVGLKPLAQGARFPQNSLARFALIGLSSEGKPRDLSGLSYQIYEEGRSFDWYQDEGRWNYKPEAQLRPIGSGEISIKADGSTVLESPVAAGNYRLEILDSNGKALAQTAFSAGWDASGAIYAQAQPLNVTLPKNLQAGRDAVLHVVLPEPSMLTVLVADTRIRKVVHEFRPKGDNAVVFSPAADWQKTVHFDITAKPQRGSKPDSSLRRAVVDAALAQGEDKLKGQGAGVVLLSSNDPTAFVLRKGKETVLTFGLENTGSVSETYRTVFSGSPGLGLGASPDGKITLSPKEGQALSLTLSGTAVGAKDLRFEVSGAHTPRVVRNWPLFVAPDAALVRSGETIVVEGQKPIEASRALARKDAPVLLSRRSMNGVPEILTYVATQRPFTTEELALTLDALRGWRNVFDKLGVLPDFETGAREQEYLIQLLRHQNADGGFASYRGGASTMADTAAAIKALSVKTSKQGDPAKNLAISWIKQRLANTWFDEKERDARAEVYAALAVAEAIDPASLHYFSDTSASSALSAKAEVHMAAAFKRIKEPDAAAFWIKKMLEEHGTLRSPSVLGALAATDALSSDDVLKATEEMAGVLRNNGTPELKDAAALLSAIAANNALAGKAHVTNKNDTQGIWGVLVMSADVAAAYRNDEAQPLYATFVAEAPQAAGKGPLSRKVYRLNGVEMPPAAKPTRNEIYMVELKGEPSAVLKGSSLLVQDGDEGLRPVGCPLSSQFDTLSFVPWLTSRGLTPFTACEYASHKIDVVLPPSQTDSFSLIYFARLDAETIGDIDPPRLRTFK